MILGLLVVGLVVVLAGGVFAVSQGSKPSASPTPTKVAVASATAAPTPVPVPTVPATPAGSAAPRYDGMVVGFVQTGTESSWRGANTASFQDNATAGGITLKLRYANNDYSTEIEALRALIADPEVQVVIFAAVQSSGWDSILKSAKAAGKPVILEDMKITSSSSLFYTYVGPDFVAEGQKGATAMCTLLESTSAKNVFEVAGYSTSQATIERAKGFRQKTGDCGLRIVASRNADWDPAQAQQMTAAYLKTNKNIQGIVAHNDSMAVGAISAIKAAGLKPGQDIQVVGYDATADGFGALISGDLGADVECNPDAAPLAYKAAWDSLHGVATRGAFTPTPDAVFYASQGANALQTILAGRKY